MPDDPREMTADDFPRLAVPRATYTVESWDHDVQGWHVEAEGLRLFALRPAIRELLGRSYDPMCSIYVRRDDGSNPSA